MNTIIPYMLHVTKNRVSRETVLNFLKFCVYLSSLLFTSVFSSVMQYTWNAISYIVKLKNIPRKYLKCWNTRDSSWPWRNIMTIMNIMNIVTMEENHDYGGVRYYSDWIHHLLTSHIVEFHSNRLHKISYSKWHIWPCQPASHHSVKIHISQHIQQ